MAKEIKITRITDHPYTTTWRLSTATSGPFVGEQSPDLDKPCLVCRGPWQLHDRMSLAENVDGATEEG